MSAVAKRSRRVHRMMPPGSDQFPIENHHPGWFRSQVHLYVDDEALEHLAARDIERDAHADVIQSLALPPGHPPWIYEWPVDGATVKVIGRLPPRETGWVVRELIKAGALTVTAYDTNGDWHVYPPLKESPP